MSTFAEIILIATEEGEGGGGAELLLPETNELIAGLIAFALVFIVVWRFAVPAINRLLEQRQAAIAGQIAEAERAKAEAESLLADYKAQLAEAKADGNKIIEEARGTAEQMRADIVAKAEADAGQIVAKAREEAEAEKARALTDARVQVGEMSVDLAGRIVGATLDAKAHQQLVDRYLADLEQI